MRIVILITSLAIFQVPLFFTVSGLLGYEYQGLEESSIYVRYVTSIFVVTTITYVYTFLSSPKISRTETIFYVFIGWMLLNHIIWLLIDSISTQLAPENLIFFVVFALPGFFVARILNHFNLWIHFIRFIEVIAMIMAISLITIAIFPFLSGVRIAGIGGASYQAASYYAAFAFGLLGFYTFRADNVLRYRFSSFQLIKLSNIALMVGLFITTILNGGRGAFILLIIYCFLIFYWVATKRGIFHKSIFRILISLSTVPVICYWIYLRILDNPLLGPGLLRATEYIGSGGIIDLEAGSSGRDRVYDVALQGISESPVWGYGAFDHWNKVIHPHNIFLDLALQFGVPFSIVSSVTLFILILRKQKPWDTQKVFLLTILMYPAINLLFSSGYFFNSFFWFGLASYLDSKNSYCAKTLL